ncbi:hypothetical protein TCAL_14237 [Tigriopus californicus]|uniref:Uncharacterized protein n=1 Tax=Tigriopus californicus TaxID=6832 RepID=A0A553NUV2_TIGCA|nr:S phase cyclin A-associated protein in the endoplasmic reticulum-like [Tigriopus californicus]TRY69208.1 hypothetical protein TCAL_14237 [Tigriopus californicus]
MAQVAPVEAKPPSSPDHSRHVHRLVQDENAKTILLNVPLEVSVASDPSTSLRPFKKPLVPPMATSPRSAAETLEHGRQRKTPRDRAPNLRKSVTTSAASAASAASATMTKPQRIRSASVGRDKKFDLQARYWAFLFENLRRAVDDLYHTCEADDSIPAAKEVILVLENYVRDFRNLCDWLKLEKEYENTPPPQRPTSLAWEVRKTSPAGKLAPASFFPSHRLLMGANPVAKRALSFDDRKDTTISRVEEAKEDVTPEEISIEPAPLAEEGPAEPKWDDEPQVTPVDMSIDPEEEKENIEGDTVNGPVKSMDESKPGRRPSSVNLVAGKASPALKSSRSTNTVKSRPASAPRAASSGPRSGSTSTGVTVKSTSTASPKLMRRYSSTVKDGKVLPMKPKSQEAQSNKPQRISLVARQSLVTSSANNSGNSVAKNVHAKTNTLIRSKTTLTQPSRSSGRPLKMMQNPPASLPPSKATSIASTPSTPGHPYGSTSSISSTSSCRSWADTVKGLKTPRSVESIASKPTKKPDDDPEEGWETVRSRGRTRFSPSNHRDGDKSKRPLMKRDSLDSNIKVKHSAKSRYQVPSSALSLPTLALMEEESVSESSNSANSAKPSSVKTSSSKSSLDKVSEGGKNSSSESLTGKSKKKASSCTPVFNKPRPRPLTLKTDKAKVEARMKETSDKLVQTAGKAINENHPRNDSSSMTSSTGSKHDLESEENDDLGALTPHKFEKLLDGLSWSEQMELEEKWNESRYPGRAIQLHEKLSSPARKKEPQVAFREHQEKQKQARLRRERYQDEKAQRLGAKNAKIENVIAQKEQMINEKKGALEDKMKKAEEKRLQYIEGIRRKAHEEEAKLKEIAFINELQAQNTRIDMLTHNQTIDEKHEERLAELAEERARKAEEREAKEARAEQRRKDLEEKRQANLNALRERIKSREERIMEEQEQTRKDREEAAREKARDREEKLSTVRANEEGQKVELQEKIQIKHEEAAKRHKEKLDRVRQKALELSVQKCSSDDNVPTLKAYECMKKCQLCQVLILNEVDLQSHLRGRKHLDNAFKESGGMKLSGDDLQTFNLKFITDAEADEQDPKVRESRERLKAMKKRSKKIKSRMSIRTAEFERTVIYPTKLDSQFRGKIGKSLKELEKLLSSQVRGPLPNVAITTIERALGEISRALTKGFSADKTCFFGLKGFGTLARIYHLLDEQKLTCIIPLKSVVNCSRCWALACQGHRVNVDFVLKNNHLTTLSDILFDRLEILVPSSNDDLIECPPSSELQVDPVARAIMDLLAQVLEDLSKFLREDGKTIEQGLPHDLIVRSLDLVSYIVSVGIIDKLAAYLNQVQSTIDSKPEVGEFLLSVLQFMAALAGVSDALVKTPNDPKTRPSDPTHLLQAFQVTDLAGTVSMLYGILLPQGGPNRDENSNPPKLPSHAIAVATSTSQLLFRMIRQHLPMVQDVLGQEGISLEFRHIASYLLWYCQGHNEQKLMHLIILLVGHFAARHPDNQGILQSGHQPSVLQQLCNLPITYFSQPDLKKILFPTLIAACHNHEENLNVLKQEMSYQMLEDFMSGLGKDNLLIQLILS